MTTVRGLYADTTWRQPLGDAARATVGSSFDHALNLELAGGALVTVLSRRGRPAPGGLIIDAEVLPRVPAGMLVPLGTSMPLGDLTVDTRDLDWFDCWVQPSRALSPVDPARLRRAMRSVAVGGSFLDTPGSSPVDRAVAARLQNARRAYQRALRAPHRIREAVEGLVGLGFGLTPSGDDYLVGSLALLHTTGGHAPIIRSLADALAATMHGTTDVSRHFLEAALDGRFHLDVRRVAEAVLTDSPGLEERFHLAADIGSTSGADVLTGLVDTFDFHLSYESHLSHEGSLS